MPRICFSGRIFIWLVLFVILLSPPTDYFTLKASTAECADETSGYLGLSLEELMNINIVSASLREESLSKAAAPMYVVTSREIKERGYSTLKDVMDDVPGYVDLSDSNENIVGVRGAYASTTNKILILIDGHRMNSLALGRYNTDQFIGMDSVDRIEFIMGPGSVLYGTGALVGVVNIITKKGADAEGLFVRGGFGDFHDEHTISYGKTTSDFDLFTNFTYLDGDGDEISQPASLDVVPVGQTQAPGVVYWNRYPENWSGLMTIRYRDTELYLRRGHAARATPRVPNGSFYNYEQEEDTGYPAYYMQDDFYVDLKHRILLDEQTTLTVNPSYHWIHLEEQSWIASYASNRLPPLGSRSGQDSVEVHWQLKSYIDHQFSETLSAMLGVDVLYVDFQRADGLLITDGTTVSQPTERMKLSGWPLVGEFAQLSWQPTEKLTVTGGLRYDTFDAQADPKLSSRFGVVYAYDDHWTIKGLYGESYLSPQWEHTNLNPNLFAFASNSSLEPEELRSGDLIVQYQKDNVSGWMDVFVHDIDGIISPTTQAGKQIYSNLGRSQYWGMETGFRVDLNESWQLSGSYSLVRDTGKSDDQFIQGGHIKNVPEHILRYGVRYQASEDLTLNLWGRSYSSVETSDSVTGDTKIPSWSQLDFAAIYEKENFELRFKVINLLNDQHEVGGSVTRPLARYGRGCMVSLGYRF